MSHSQIAGMTVFGYCLRGDLVFLIVRIASKFVEPALRHEILTINLRELLYMLSIPIQHYFCIITCRFINFKLILIVIIVCLFFLILSVFLHNIILIFLLITWFKCKKGYFIAFEYFVYFVFEVETVYVQVVHEFAMLRLFQI